jgi:trans-AT polyketide synthase/acyltransferase/oxidoreductase domain-containing protein
MERLRKSRQLEPIGTWEGQESDLKTLPDDILEVLKDLDSRCYILEKDGQIALSRGGVFHPGRESKTGIPVVGSLRSQSPEYFGNPDFLTFHGLKYPYMAGSMANAISGEELVIALGKNGYLGSYGAGGVSPERILKAITTIKKELPQGPYAFNLIHSPNEPVLEQKAVDLYLEHQVRTIEASAFLRLTPTVVQYRAAGITEDEGGNPVISNKVIAKLSRREVALHFLNPPPQKILTQLVNEGKISSRQAELAKGIPMADDLTVEADSGGHTDNRPLAGLLPSLIALRDEIQRKNKYTTQVRVGAAGGIGTPAAALGAFTMGAEYIVTGSINQSCVEAGTSPQVKEALAQAAATDVMMSPSADMFEMGVKVQVLKRGTMFPMRAQKLYEIYTSYESIDDIEPGIRQELEEKIFKMKLEEIWEECVRFFTERDPSQLKKATDNPKRKMALIFRWYLGLATHWGIQGIQERAMDYQVWCGPAMGSFNDWTRGTSLEDPANRDVVRVAEEVMKGAAYLYRLVDLRMQGFNHPGSWNQYLE